VKPRTDQALRSRLAREQAEQRLPSVVAGLVRSGELVWSAGAGQLGIEAAGAADSVQYRCGSITKTFVAVQVMRLRDEGRLELTDPLERHLPGAFDGVTIAQLLTHSSGLRAETAGLWWERTAGGDFDDLVAASLHPSDLATSANPARLTRPGRRFHYSNIGFALLGEVVSRLRGAPWPQTLQEELLDPLGMTRTSMRPLAPHATGYAVHPFADVLLTEPEHDAGAMAPAGQLWTTVADLARWTAFLAQGGRPLAIETLREMREPQALDDRRGAPWTGAHGLGLQVWNADGVRSIGHGGSMPGFLALIRFADATGDGAVVMANATSGMRPSLAEELTRILDEHEPAPPQAWAPARPPDGTFAALGRWFWGTSAYTLRAIGSSQLSLEPEPSGGRSARFLPNPDGTWTGQDGYFAGETLRIRRDGPDGTGNAAQSGPVALELASFIFTRSPYNDQADVPGGIDPRGWHVPEVS
jgi:CubicO group peptidase (beta-lactamase class C family)